MQGLIRVGVIVYAVLIVSQGTKPLLIAAGFVSVALLWYVVYGRRGYSRSSALVTLVRRLSEPDYGVVDLENELLGILMERDGIKEDRFDTIIMNAPVLDYAGMVDRAKVFEDVSRILAQRWELDKGKLNERFLNRENLTSTIISSGVAVPHAIPHAIVEGESIFDIALVRSRFGIQWTDTDVVYTAFAMVGSGDERNFHLRALMAVAQTLQDPSFSEKWNRAEHDRELRTAVILSKRNRQP
jgi:basic amino acid/polyamine antiporter, APA family